MIDYLKKRWIWFLFMALLAIILFILTPQQEKSYLQPELKAIEKRSLIIVFILFGVLSLFAAFYFFRHSKLSEITDLLGTISGLLFFAYFIFNPFFKYAFLSLNKIKKNEVIEKRIIVATFNNDKSCLVFFDMESKEILPLQKDQIKVDTNGFTKADTIKLEFKKGLFGYNYLGNIQKR